MSSPDRARSRRLDTGSATILVLALAGILVVVAVGGVLGGAATVARHRADAAADLAALAAAQVAGQGPAAACSRAAAVARRAGGRLVRCSLADAVSDVSVAVSLHGWPAALGPVLRRARAGPAG